jgi:hypothetical protein
LSASALGLFQHNRPEAHTSGQNVFALQRCIVFLRDDFQSVGRRKPYPLIAGAIPNDRRLTYESIVEPIMVNSLLILFVTFKVPANLFWRCDPEPPRIPNVPTAGDRLEILDVGFLSNLIHATKAISIKYKNG